MAVRFRDGAAPSGTAHSAPHTRSLAPTESHTSARRPFALRLVLMLAAFVVGAVGLVIAPADSASAAITYMVTVEAEPTNAGIPQPATTPNQPMAEGTTVELEAFPKRGYRFIQWEYQRASGGPEKVQWTDGTTSTSSQRQITSFKMPAAMMNFKARYAKAFDVVAGTAVPAGGGTAQATAIPAGFRIEAKANPGYRFANWTFLMNGAPGGTPGSNDWIAGSTTTKVASFRNTQSAEVTAVPNFKPTTGTFQVLDSADGNIKAYSNEVAAAAVGDTVSLHADDPIDPAKSRFHHWATLNMSGNGGLANWLNPDTTAVVPGSQPGTLVTFQPVTVPVRKVTLAGDLTGGASQEICIPRVGSTDLACGSEGYASIGLFDGEQDIVRLKALPDTGGHYRFDGWKASDGTNPVSLDWQLGDASTPNASFKMPRTLSGANLEITPVYTQMIDLVPANVEPSTAKDEGADFTMSHEWAAPRDHVTVQVTHTPTGWSFDHWTLNGRTDVTWVAGDETSPTAIFEAPGQYTEVRAHFVRAYTLTMGASTPSGAPAAQIIGDTNGDSREVLTKDALVTVKAPTTDPKWLFDKWVTSPGVGWAVGNANNPQATFKMPPNDVTITAKYTQRYQLATDKANGAGFDVDPWEWQPEDTMITATFTGSPSGTRFDEWKVVTTDTNGPVSLWDSGATPRPWAKFRMPAAGVTISATLKGTHTITFDRDRTLVDVTATPNTNAARNTAAAGDEVTLQATVLKAGWRFTGWKATAKDPQTGAIVDQPLTWVDTDPSDPIAVFQMPDTDVTIKPVMAQERVITVNDAQPAAAAGSVELSADKNAAGKPVAIPGEILTIEAKAAQGYRFSKWLGLDSSRFVTGDASTAKVTYRAGDRDFAFGAKFLPTNALNLTTEVRDLAGTVVGTADTDTPDAVAGDTVRIWANASRPAADGSYYRFKGWDNSGPAAWVAGYFNTPNVIVKIGGNGLTMKPVFERVYDVSFVPGTAHGGVSLSPNERYTYGVGDTVTLDAGQDAQGWRFSQWSGVPADAWATGKATDRRATFRMPAGDLQITPVYTELHGFQLITEKDTLGANASSDVAASGGRYWAAPGDPVTLRVNTTPQDMVFTQWWIRTTGDWKELDVTWTAGGKNDEIATFTMPDPAIEIRAQFAQSYPLALGAPDLPADLPAADAPGAATISRPAAAEGQPVTVTAQAKAGLRFTGWRATDTKNSASKFNLKWTAGDAKQLKATFTMPRAANGLTLTPTYVRLYPLTLTAAQGSRLDAGGLAEAAKGDQVQVTATLDARGWAHGGWKIPATVTDAQQIDGDRPVLKFTMPAGPVTIENKTIAKHAVSFNSFSYGQVRVDRTPDTAAPGEPVTLSVTATDPRWRFNHWDVTTGNVAATDWTAGSSTTEAATFTMPNTEVKISPVFDVVYTLTKDTPQGARFELTPATAVAGETVTLRLLDTPDDTRFDQWTGVPDAAWPLTDSKLKSTTTFVMPASDLVVAPKFTTIYKLQVTGQPGVTQIDQNTMFAAAGEVVAATVQLDGANYAFDGWDVPAYVPSHEAINSDGDRPVIQLTMPKSDVTVTAKTAAKQTVTFDSFSYGQVAVASDPAYPHKVAAGQPVTLSVSATDAAWRFNHWDVTSRNVAATDWMAGGPTAESAAFTMPDTPVTIRPVFVRVHQVVKDTPQGGDLDASPTAAVEGEEVAVKLTATPTGQGFSHWTGVPAGAWKIGNEYQAEAAFTMPDRDVTVTPVFVDTPALTFTAGGLKYEVLPQTRAAAKPSVAVIGLGATAEVGGSFTVDIPAQVTHQHVTYVVTQVKDGAFKDRAEVTALKLGDAANLARIGAEAFADAKGLSGDVTVPANVREVGASAFGGTGLTRATFAIPATELRIAPRAFAGSALDYLQLPPSDKLTLADGALEGLDDLDVIVFDSDQKEATDSMPKGLAEAWEDLMGAAQVRAAGDSGLQAYVPGRLEAAFAQAGWTGDNVRPHGDADPVITWLAPRGGQPAEITNDKPATVTVTLPAGVDAARIPFDIGIIGAAVTPDFATLNLADGRHEQLTVTPEDGRGLPRTYTVGIAGKPRVSDPGDQSVTGLGEAQFDSSIDAVPPATDMWWERQAPGATAWTRVSHGDTQHGSEFKYVKDADGTGHQLNIADVAEQLSGYKFRLVVRNEKGETPSKPATLSVTPKAVTYPITVGQADGGSAKAAVTEAVPGKIVMISATPQDRYRFVGWQAPAGLHWQHPDGAASATARFEMPAAPVSVVPMFVRIADPVLIAFDAGNGKIVKAPPARLMEVGTPLGRLPLAARAGHVFLGWAASPKGGQLAASDTLATAPVTYHAIWVKAGKTVKWKSKAFILNKKAKAGAKTVKKVKHGAKIRVIGRKGEWNKVRLASGKTGWVKFTHAARYAR
jgi:hypothetical protein